MALVLVRKGNVELNIPLEEKDKYLKLGYSVYEGDKLVEEAPTTDVGALTAKVIELTEENKQLKATIEKLTAKKSSKKSADIELSD